MNNNIIFGVAVVIILALIGGGVWFLTKDAPQDDPTKQEGFSFDLTVPQPSLDRPLVFPESFPAEARTAIETNAATLKEELEKGLPNIPPWLDLAILYKTIEDYEGAAEVWIYLTEATPNNSTPYHNLGNLYHLFLKDFEKSEEYYRKAIEINISQPIHYLGLHELYRYSYKTETDAAVEILEEGIDVMPEAVDMMTALGTYYKDRGDVEKAIEWFEKARDVAADLGNISLVQQIENEIRALEN